MNIKPISKDLYPVVDYLLAKYTNLKGVWNVVMIHEFAFWSLGLLLDEMVESHKWSGNDRMIQTIPYTSV